MSNIVKETCKELGVTQKELECDSLKRIEISEKLIALSSVQESDKIYASYIADNMKSIKSEKDVRDLLEEKMLSYNLKQEIKSLGMTQKGFAEHIGVNQNTVTTWVNNSVPVPKWIKPFIVNYHKAKTLDLLLNELEKVKII